MSDSEDDDVPATEGAPNILGRRGISPPPPSEASHRNSSFRTPRRDEEGWFSGFGGSGANLRGSGRSSRERDEFRREVLQYIPREVKLSMKALPLTYAEYPPYRNLLGVKVMACGLPGSITIPWLREMDTLTRDELKIRYLGFSDTVLDLESKVYSVLLDAAQGVAYLRYSTAMIQECNRGAGREAVKTLDRLYQYSKRTEMTDAADDWYLLTCTSIDEVGNFVANLRTSVAKLSSGGQQIHPDLLLTKIKNTVKPFAKEGVPELSARFARFEAQPEENQDWEDLLQLLEKGYMEWKKEQEKAAAFVRKASSRAWEAGISSPVRELSSYINNSSSLDSGGVDIVHPAKPACMLLASFVLILGQRVGHHLVGPAVR